METKRICPSCQKPLAADGPMGLCPECLVKAGFPSGVESESGSAARSAFVPPPVADIAKLFPQLEVIELIGKGGMGAVYKARQIKLNRIVALKILPPGTGQEPAFAARFTREAQALAQLNHPGIVTLYEFGETSGQFYFLMEFVDGVNLRQLLAGSRVSAREALAIVPQICDALQYAHDAGIVHRDIKPENILMDRRGRVKVADFGLAKIVAAVCDRRDSDDDVIRQSQTAATENLTDVSKVMGTPQYMSPEQIQAPGEVDHRADIYALGVVFYQMLTGELPGKKLEAPSTKVQIDVRLDAVVLRALEKTPELRYQQVSDVKTMCETIASTPPPKATEPSAPVASQSWQSPTSGWGWLVGKMSGITFTSPRAYRWANLSALGFLGSLGFLRELPFPGAQHCAGFFGLYGLFGLIGVAHIIEVFHRHRAQRMSNRPPATTVGTGGAPVIPPPKTFWQMLQFRFWPPMVVRCNGQRVIHWPAVTLRVIRGLLLLFPTAAIFIIGGINSHESGRLAWFGVAWLVLGLLFLSAVLAIRVLRGFSRPINELPELDNPAHKPPGGSGRESALIEKPEIGNRQSEIPSRFSRPAIWAALWILVLPAGLLLNTFATLYIAEQPRHDVMRYVIGLPGIVLIGLGILGVFGTTILGWIAVSQIRRSTGKIYGLGLAVFDGLLFPLLTLDGVFVWVVRRLVQIFVEFYSNFSNLNNPQVHPSFTTQLANLFSQHSELVAFIAVSIIIVVDFLIIRAVWRAVNGGSPSPSAEQAAINEAEWRDPRNWSAGIYFSKRDSRTHVPKRIPALGWTVNLGRWQGVLLLFGVILLVVAALVVGLQQVISHQKQPVIQQTSGNQGTAFGPVIERVIPFDRSFIDFQTGRILCPNLDKLHLTPKGGWAQWERQNGADAMADEAPARPVFGDKDFPRLVAPSREKSEDKERCVFVREETDDFDSVRAGDADARLKIVTEQNFYWGLAWGSRPWWFQTLDGAKGALQILGTNDQPRGLKIRYKLVQPEKPAPPLERSKFPLGEVFLRNKHSLRLVHDNISTHYVLFYEGLFEKAEDRSTHNRSPVRWLEDGTIKLPNGRTFLYSRVLADAGTDTDTMLTINGRTFDLRAGRVLVLKDDGGIEQVKMFPQLSVAREPDALAPLIAKARDMDTEPVTPDKLRAQWRAAEDHLDDLSERYNARHPLVMEAQHTIEELRKKIAASNANDTKAAVVKPAPAAVFGLQAERMIAATDANPDGLVAFRFENNFPFQPPVAVTGHFKDPAKIGFTPELRRWMQDENVDLLFYFDKKAYYVLSFNLRTGWAGQPKEWDTILPDCAGPLLTKLEKLNSEPTGPSIMGGCGYRDGLGEVSVFRTRDGLVGFYQLRGLADADGRGVNIRYKLVQGGATNAAAAKPKMRAPQAVTATGSLIDGSQVAAKAGTTSKWVCWAAVAEADITAVSVGQDVIMTLEAFPQRTFQGKVAYIGNMPDTTQNQVTYETLIDLADPDPKFKAGMSANIMFSVAQHEGATNAAAGDKPAPVFHGASFVLPLRQAPAPAEAAPVPVPVVVRNIPALLPIGGILLLLVGGIAAIVLAVRKSKLGAGRTMAIGCGVIMLGFVLVLLLVAVSFMGKTFQAAATRWSVQHARLQSARSTPSVAPGLAFGPVVEREIPSGKSCLRLATGDLIPMSAPALSGDDVRKLRGDVYQPMIENDANALTILDVNVLELDAAAWDSLSASDLENQFPLKASTERASQRRSETRIPPGVYGFKTYDKAGILQVLGMNGSGVKIRYKLVQNTITPAASVSMPPAAPPPVRDSRLQFRLVAEANDSTAELLPDHRGKQQFRVRREILLDDAAVAEAKVNGEGSNTAIDLIFTEAGGKRFAAITSANRGKQLAVIFDGKVLFAPLIHDAVTAGFAQINGNFTLDEAKLIARVLMAKAVPRFTALIACFNGKVDSGSSCSGNNFQPDGTIHPKGKMTCGYPGKVSEVEWAFVEQRGGKDVYRFTRRFPADTAKAATTSKDIEFSDRRVVVFADAFQAVVIEPAKNTNAVSSTPKL